MILDIKVRGQTHSSKGKCFECDAELIQFGFRRGQFDRQDSLRSDYMSDRESRGFGMVHQASIESTDSRLCYLTSSEVSTTKSISICLSTLFRLSDLLS